MGFCMAMMKGRATPVTLELEVVLSVSKSNDHISGFMEQNDNLNMVRNLEDQDINDDLKWSLRHLSDITLPFTGKYLALFSLL